jgi:hypothetical protein
LRHSAVWLRHSANQTGALFEFNWRPVRSKKPGLFVDRLA